MRDVTGDLTAPSQELLRPLEVCQMLGVSRSWLYTAAHDGRIPSVRLGGPDGPLRFIPADIQAWLQNSRATWSPGRAAPAS
jgi:excisionase family DNA binding protein